MALPALLPPRPVVLFCNLSKTPVVGGGNKDRNSDGGDWLTDGHVGRDRRLALAPPPSSASASQQRCLWSWPSWQRSGVRDLPNDFFLISDDLKEVFLRARRRTHVSTHWTCADHASGLQDEAGVKSVGEVNAVIFLPPPLKSRPLLDQVHGRVQPKKLNKH